MQISLAWCGQETDFPELTSPSIINWRQSPSRHAVEACFLHDFWLRETTYNRLMSQTTLSMCSAWASLDHTFRCVSNIGLVRLADNHWVKQYSGLLCVLNGDGEVLLSWKFTKSLSFATAATLATRATAATATTLATTATMLLLLLQLL